MMNKEYCCLITNKPTFWQDGRWDRIRTYDPLDPNQVRYQAAPLTDILLFVCAEHITWCGRRDLNSHAVKHWNLNPACLPIPPLPQNFSRTRDTQSSILLIKRTTSTFAKKVGWTMGFEPTTAGITIQSSTNWATPTTVFTYTTYFDLHGGPRRTRTFDPRLRKPLLYPAELWNPVESKSKWSVR